MRLSTFIDANGDYFDAVHFTDVVEKYPVNGLGVYASYGRITDRFDFYIMNVSWSSKMGVLQDPRNN